MPLQSCEWPHWAEFCLLFACFLLALDTGDENLASRQHGEDQLQMPMPRSDFQQHVWVHGCEGKQLCDTNGCQYFNDGQVPMHLRQTTYRWIRQCWPFIVVETARIKRQQALPEVHAALGSIDIAAAPPDCFGMATSMRVHHS